MALLERDACLGELDLALRDAVSGEGRVALVSGEAGIGKTSLVEWFARERRGSVRVLWGACDALFTPRPLGPLHDMAAQMQGDAPALLNSDANRAAVFSAVLSELQGRPAIAVFEDVHWADEATLDLLRFLGRRMTRTTALLVMTYRDDELGSRHPLRTVLGDLATSPATRRIPLRPLTEEAVRTLVGERVIDAAALHRQTGGNPFFVTEVLASAGGGLPPSVRDAVLARTARLSPSAQAVVQAAAVIGPRIEPWVLADVTGAEAGAVDECVAIGVLLTQGEALAFRHELARQTILESISPPHKMALHRMTLDVLKASPATRHDLSRLAHHAEAASDREAVLACAPAAAEQAAAASAHREAASLYALALRFADDLPTDRRAQLLQAYAQECSLVGRQAESITVLRRALKLWGDLDNPLKQGETLAELMAMLIQAGQTAEVEGGSRTAIAMLEALPLGRELALAYRVRASLHLANRDCAEALVWAEKARTLAERFADVDLLAALYVTIGTAWLFLDYERGCEHLRRGLDFARDAGLERWVVNMYGNLGSGSGELYQFLRAERFLAEGIAHATEHDIDSFRLYMLAWQALTHVHLGRWRAAAAMATEVLHRPSASVMSRLTVRVALGRLRARRGDPGVYTVLDEALELATRADNIQRLGPVRAVRAEAAWLAGDCERTVREARAVYDLAVSKRHPWVAGELAFWRKRAGDAVAPPGWIAPPFAFHLAGDWRTAAAAWERLGCPYEQARALADGDRAAQTAALAIFDRLGAQPAAADLRRRMRAAGLRSIPRGPRPTTRDNPFGLTSRQMDILALLAEGLTNAKIATRLYLSPKTVDHHTSAVLAKLGVHSREAASAWAREHLIHNPPK
jgi:DNA-binding CsgD family transcriptional regulator/tetratricopeptide (TPR) repeat protein